METYDFRMLAKFSEEKFQVVHAFRHGNQRGTLLCLEEGQKVPEHGAEGTVIVLPLQGEITFFTDDVPTPLSLGKAVRFPMTQKHSLVATTRALVLVIVSRLKEQESVDPTQKTDSSE